MSDRMAGGDRAGTKAIRNVADARGPMGRTAKCFRRLAGLVFLTVFATLAALAPSRAAECQANGLRSGIHDFGYRLVIDLSQRTPYRLALSLDGRHLVVTLPDVRWAAPASGSLYQDEPLDRYRFITTGRAGGSLMIDSRQPMRVLRSFPLDPDGRDGHRLVLDLAPVAEAAQADFPGMRETLRARPRLAALLSTPLPAEAGGAASAPTQIAQTTSVPFVPEPNLGPPLPLSDGRPDRTPPVLVRGALVTGATVFRPTDFRPFYRDLIGKPASLDAMKKAAERMTAHYRNAGYVLSQVIVPEQQAASGVIRFQAIEGFIDSVVIEGEVAGSRALFDQWKEKIRASKPLRAEVLERYTLLANDLPGTTVKSVLRPAKDVPGASDLILKITHKYVDASLTFDNRASKTTGPNESTAVVAVNSAFGQHERTTLTYNAATDRDQSEYIGLTVDLPVDAEGTTASLAASYAKSAPGDILKDLELKSKTTTLGLSAKHPLIRSREETLNLTGGVTLIQAKSDALSSRLYEDKIRTLDVGADYSVTDFLAGENKFGLTLTQGLGILGATETGEGSRGDGKATFTKVTASAGRLQALPHDLSLSATLSGQWSTVPLLASQEFSYGGGSFGRAYDSSEITGDRGMALALELQYTARPDDIPSMKYFQPFVFWDQGVTWDIDATDDTEKRSGASAGVGFRTAITDYLFGSLEIGWPLTRPLSLADEEDGNDPRVFFNLSAKY